MAKQANMPPAIMNFISAQKPDVQEKLMKLPPQLLAQAAQNEDLQAMLLEVAGSKEQPSNTEAELKKIMRVLKNKKFTNGEKTAGLAALIIGGGKYALNEAFGQDIPVVGIRNSNSSEIQSINEALASTGKTYESVTPPRSTFWESVKTGGIVFALSSAMNTVTSYFIEPPEMKQQAMEELMFRQQLWAMMNQQEEVPQDMSRGMAQDPRHGLNPRAQAAQGQPPQRGFFG